MTPSTAPHRFELVIASAGSGKTFRVSSQIIGLLAAGVAPNAIFASTFTRKAAGEILDRVLARLAQAATSAEEAQQLASFTHVPRSEATPQFWMQVLARTMREIHRIDIGTLDSFFARTARSFAHELGLPPDWSLGTADELERIEALAVQQVLTHADRDLMLSLLRELMAADAGRSIHRALVEQTATWLTVVRDLDPNAQGWSAFEDAFATQAPSTVDPDELARQMARLEVPPTHSGTPNKNWAKARDQLTEALRRRDWAGLLEQRLVTASTEPELRYSSIDIPDDWLDLLEHVRSAARSALISQLVQRARALERLGERFIEERDRLLASRGVLDFGDVTWKVGGGAGVTGHADRDLRMDAGIRHLLLDEFQDTSREQWRALEPLADQIMQGDENASASAVIVADPKQSIYGWRGAEPVLLEPVARRYGLHEDRLETSYRSSPTVLDAVNRTFTALERSAFITHTRLEGPQCDAVVEWLRAFSPHRAADPRKPGHVRLEAGPPSQGNRAIQPAQMRFAARRVQELTEQFPAHSIGVLVRTNAQVGRLIHELRALDLDVSEEGGTRLVDSPAVVSVLALLRLADHPGDALARYHVMHTPMAQALEEFGVERLAVDDEPSGSLSEATARELSIRLRAALMDEGYGRVLARLSRALERCTSQRDALRLDQLTQIGFDHDRRPDLRVDHFVARVLHERREGEGTAPVRVMTIWGSKGLEFDLVVLPALSFRIPGRQDSGTPFVYRPDSTAAATHVFPPMKGVVRSLFEPDCFELRQAAEDEVRRSMRDGLSALYVAMTRARSALHMIIPADTTTPSKSPTAANLLRAQLHESGGDPFEPIQQGQVLFDQCDEAWGAGADEDSIPRRSAPEPTVPQIRLRTSASRSRNLLRRSPSEHAPAHPLETLRWAVERAQSATLAEADSANPPALVPTLRGTLVHAWLEQVEWLEGDGGLPDGPTRHRIAAGIARAEAHPITTEQIEREWATLEAQLERPEILAALARPLRASDVEPSDPGNDERHDKRHEEWHVEVERELPFLHRQGDTLVEGVIDRLVLERRAGQVVSAQVIDYKTDRIPADDPARLDERIALYSAQLRSYRDAVAALYTISCERIRLTLLFLDVGRAIDVS